MHTKTKSFRWLPFFIFGLAIVFKIFLFIFAQTHAPSAKTQIDSNLYLEAAKTMAQTGAFAARQKDGIVKPVTLRTPGYPIFLALFHNILNIPLTGIILIQIGLTLLAAWMTYKTAVLIDLRYGFLSAVIVLYDLPTTVASLMILTESLFLFFMTVFMFNFVKYVKEQKFNRLILSSVLLVCLAFIRPLVFYLPVVISFYIVCLHARVNLKRGIGHALVCILITYGSFMPWLLRNYQHTGQFSFSTIRTITMDTDGLWRSYSRNKDTLAAGTSPAGYYAGVTTSGILNLLTYPGTLKYFGSQPLKFWGKVIAYPWVVFWFAGFIAGALKSGRNPCLMLFLSVIMYLVAVTIWTTLSSAMGRFRVPMVPYLAILSAHGWFLIVSYVRSKNPKSV